MAITVSQSLQSVTPGSTADHEVTFTIPGNPAKITVFIEVTAGTISANINGLGASGIAVASGSKFPPFDIRPGVDVLHIDAASNTDSFTIGVSKP